MRLQRACAKREKQRRWQCRTAAGRTAKGTAIVNLLQLNQGEKVTAVMPVEDFNDDTKFVLMATANGLIKKTALSEYGNIR